MPVSEYDRFGPPLRVAENNCSVGGIGSGKEQKRGGIGKAMSKGLFKAKNPAQIQRQEDETRARMNSASEQFKRAVQENQAVKQEFFNLQLPKILRVSVVTTWENRALTSAPPSAVPLLANERVR